MKNTILRTNAAPIYAFLSFIAKKQMQEELGQTVKILDCGAGGRVPPLALFSEYDFDTYGIDISDEQLKRAKEYCDQRGLVVDLRKADMRQIPFPDAFFDCVYEHYAMCHLSKQETAVAIQEMHRVTRKGGFCFLGVISIDSFPKSLFGEEKETGEFWEDESRHTMFTDQELDQLVDGWEMLTKEKRVIYLWDAAEEISEDAWIQLKPVGYSDEDWKNKYGQRHNYVNYSHIYTILRKE